VATKKWNASNVLTNNFGSDVLELCLWSSDEDADGFADWDRTESFSPATHTGRVDHEERNWTPCSNTSTDLQHANSLRVMNVYSLTISIKNRGICPLLF